MCVCVRDIAACRSVWWYWCAVGDQCRYDEVAVVKPAAAVLSKSSLQSSAALKSTPSVVASTDASDVCSSEVLSNSSLRRKLFFQHSDETAPVSPVRYHIVPVLSLYQPCQVACTPHCHCISPVRLHAPGIATFSYFWMRIIVPRTCSMGALEMAEPMELLSGIWTPVNPSNLVLDGAQITLQKWALMGGIHDDHGWAWHASG